MRSSVGDQCVLCKCVCVCVYVYCFVYLQIIVLGLIKVVINRARHLLSQGIAGFYRGLPVNIVKCVAAYVLLQSALEFECSDY